MKVSVADYTPRFVVLLVSLTTHFNCSRYMQQNSGDAEQQTVKDVEGNSRGLLCGSLTFPAFLRNSVELQRTPASRSPGRDSKRGSPEHKGGIKITTRERTLKSAETFTK